MIDRKGLWALILLCLATTIAAVWRLSLLPDWTHMPMLAPHGLTTKNGLVLFILPLTLLFMIAVFSAQRWLVSGPDEALAVWYRRGSLLPMMSGVLTAFMQASLISRSFGLGHGLNPEIVARVIMGVTGILTMMFGNVVPKLPMLSTRVAALNLNPWKSARHTRFGARMTVAFGLAMTVAAVLLPIRFVAPVFLTVALAFFGGSSGTSTSSRANRRRCRSATRPKLPPSRDPLDRMFCSDKECQG
jgi:hypothetical protein